MGICVSSSLRALLSEFGGSNNTMCENYLGQLLSYLANNDVYIGWAGKCLRQVILTVLTMSIAWAAGPIWGSSPACCNDGNPVGSLEPGNPSQYQDVWLTSIQPYIPVDVKRSGVSSLT